MEGLYIRKKAKNGVIKKKGRFINGLLDGKGIIYKEDGSKIEGMFREGKIQGVAKVTDSEGVQIERDYGFPSKTFSEETKVESIPMINFTEGSKYLGDMKKGVPHGKGKFIYKNKNTTFEGSFKEGMFDGQGKYKTGDDLVYNGNFTSGKMNGYGTFIWPNGFKYVGFWNNDEMHG